MTVELRATRQVGSDIEWCTSKDADAFSIYVGEPGAFRWSADFAHYQDARNFALDVSENEQTSLIDYVETEPDVNLVEHLEAGGLRPIIVDENTDISLALGLSKARETNEEFLVRVMNAGCPTGALIQAFIIEALAHYCDETVQGDGAHWHPGALVSFDAWKATATWLAAELEAQYGRR